MAQVGEQPSAEEINSFLSYAWMKVMPHNHIRSEEFKKIIDKYTHTCGKNCLDEIKEIFINGCLVQIDTNTEHIKESIKASASVGWGPFSISGSYGYGKTEDNLKSDFQNGEIKVPGMQIIGWVSKVVPYSPK